MGYYADKEIRTSLSLFFRSFACVHSATVQFQNGGGQSQFVCILYFISIFSSSSSCVQMNSENMCIEHIIHIGISYSRHRTFSISGIWWSWYGWRKRSIRLHWTNCNVVHEFAYFCKMRLKAGIHFITKFNANEFVLLFDGFFFFVFFMHFSICSLHKKKRKRKKTERKLKVSNRTRRKPHNRRKGDWMKCNFTLVNALTERKQERKKSENKCSGTFFESAFTHKMATFVLVVRKIVLERDCIIRFSEFGKQSYF